MGRARAKPTVMSENSTNNMNTEISTQSNSKGYILLIVDDNPTNLGVLTEYLEEQGFDILSAEYGYAALKSHNLLSPI